MRFLNPLVFAAFAGFPGAVATCDQAICNAYKQALALESMEVAGALPAGVPVGPWCKVAEGIITGMSPEDAGKLDIEPCAKVPTEAGLHEFEHRHTNYTVVGTQHLDVTCFSFIEAQDNAKSSESLAAKSVDCKMVDATRVAQQLNIKTNSSVQCLEVNKRAVDVAKRLLPSDAVQKHESTGRPFCFRDDATALFNIGPLWVEKAIKLTETDQCLEVTSTKLVSDIHSLIFPGNHYCKLLSPARAMDWILTDSVEPHDPCASCTGAISV